MIGVFNLHETDTSFFPVTYSKMSDFLYSSSVASCAFFIGNNSIHFFNFGLQIICHRYLLGVRRLKNHKPRKFGVIQSLANTIPPCYRTPSWCHTHEEEKWKIPRIKLSLSGIKNQYNAEVMNTVFPLQASAQAAFVVLQIGGTNNNITSFNNVVGVKTLRQQAIACVNIFADNSAIAQRQQIVLTTKTVLILYVHQSKYKQGG